jgi:hypothetical protein
MGKARLRLQAAGADPVALPMSDAEQVRRIGHTPKEQEPYNISSRKLSR